MTTYSLIQYDVLNDLIYFKGAPTPGLVDLINENKNDISSIEDIIQNDTTGQLTLLPSDSAQSIKDFLITVSEINLADSKDITLKLEIIDDTEVGNVDIVSVNLDETKTYVTKSGPLIIVNWTPFILYPTMGKCKNCLKFTFDEDNIFNFTGNIGGTWDSTFKNNQKVYSVDIPTFATPSSPAVYTNYRIFWKPNVTYAGFDYNGNLINIQNKHKWICVPSASIGTATEISSLTFFHVLNNFSASCPYVDPTNTWYNFIGNDGYFLLDNTILPTIQTSTQNEPCPTFNPTPGIIDWGFNCGPNGCVAAPSGSIGTYLTIGACELSCLPTSSANYGYNCTPNGCVFGDAINTGSYATLEECELCLPPPIQPTSCSCDGPNLVTNSDFSNGGSNWIFSPPTLTPGIGSWNLSTGLAVAAVAVTMSVNGSSSLMSLTQANVFQPSCSYNVCLQAWTNETSPSTNLIINTSFPLNLNIPQSYNLSPTPTAYSFILNGINTTDLTFYLALAATGSAARVYIDNVCVTLLSCPPIPEDPEVCIITGSIYTWEEVEYDCLCPEGYTSNGSGSCIWSSTGSSTIVGAIGIPTSSYSSNYAYWNQPNFATGYGGNANQPGIFVPGNYNNGSTIPNNVGLVSPSLFYQYNLDGTGNSSLGNPSPIAGNPNIHKTQYTFDILKNDFWVDPANPQPLWPATSPNAPVGTNVVYPYSRWLIKRLRSSPPFTTPAGHRGWVGCGTSIPIQPITKTYYLLVATGREFKIKLNGNTIIRTGQGLYQPLQTSVTSHPAYFQQYYSHFPATPTSGLGTLPFPLFGSNPYITQYISGSYNYPNTGTNWNIGTGYATAVGWKGASAQVLIFPITIQANACGIINVEGRGFNTCGGGWLGAVLFDNTATQIANATSLNDLNIVWDTAYLPDLSTLPSNITNFPPAWNSVQYVYLYGYDPSNEPTPSSYVSVCPANSILISGSSCFGCETGDAALNVLPCGQCIECTHGKLYNGYVVDKGGYQFQGRGSGGIINTGSMNASTWVIPAESDWDTLITYLNNGTTPSTVTGSLGTVAGGKMKDYTRGLNATCWQIPNIGAQTATGSSGWTGTAGGRRGPAGDYNGLGFEGIWWSANSSSAFPNPFQLYTRELKNISNDVYRNLYAKNYGFSLRLVRPAVAGEVDGTTIVGAYTGKDGTIYDGIVIGTQVWIDKNLSESQYNNGSTISVQPFVQPWSTSLNQGTPLSCFYDNDLNNALIPTGNTNPLTGECYTFPSYYVYQKCGTNEYLVQNVSGSTIIPGKVQKDSNQECWEFTNISTGLPNYPSQTLYTGNYFTGSNYVYDDCDECNAIHTIYMKFGTKNC